MLHTPKAICRYFNSITGCKFGTNCKFSHISNLPQFYSRSHENDEPVNYTSRIREVPAFVTISETAESFIHHEAVNNIPEEKKTFLSSSKRKSFTQKRHEAVKRQTDSERDISSSHFKNNSHHDNHEAESHLSRSKEDKVCFAYSKYGRCKFGTRCIYRHEINRNHSPSKSSDNVRNKSRNDSESSESKCIPGSENLPVAAGSQEVEGQRFRSKPCKYFKFGNCRNGVNCRFFHPDGKQKTEKAAKEDIPVSGGMKKELIDEEFEPKKEMQNQRVIIPRRPPFRPKHLENKLKRSVATEEEIKKLCQTEIQQLKRRFPRDKLKTLKEDETENVYLLRFSSSDPDWPYDVKEFEMELTFLSDYPVTCFKVVLPEQDLPETVRRYVEVSVAEWLDNKQSELEKSDRFELIFKPFIRWLDRNIEDVVTGALKQLKRELFAKAAGYEFLPASELKAKLSKQANTDSSADSDKESEEEEVLQKENVVVYRKRSNEDLEIYTGPEKNLVDVNDLDDDDDDPSLMKPFSTGNLNNERRGTEIKLQSLQLKENVSTITFTHLKMVIQCTRCKASTDVETPGGRVNMIACHKCQSVQYLTFRPAMIHQFSSVMGYLDLEDCVPFDLILQDSPCKLGCFSCGKETKLDGLSPGHVIDSWCRFCSKRMKVATEGTKFTLLLQAGVEKDKGDVHEVGTKKVQKIIKDPVIKIGNPLPDNGTCKHYKKSYRWFRFPCCGKTYPCDVCHEEKEYGHEMLLANRMICGFCCKEQPFSLEKPCVACNHSLTRASSSHWEGGKGCRDKIKMSRDDSQKYKSLNKTTSRKAAEKTSNKKSTKLRHSSK